MKTILVPTDFSNAADNAAEYAAHFAKDIKAKVLLFHAYHIPVQTSKSGLRVITQEKLQKENEIQLKKRAAHLKKIAGVEVQYRAKMGFAVDEIVEEEKNANLIVMGMQVVSKFNEVMMGSITTSTLLKSKSPVLVVPEKVKYKRLEKIALACDYDPIADVETLNKLKDIVKVFASKVYVINVKDKKNKSTSNNGVMPDNRLENKLTDVEHTYVFLENDDLVKGINEFVDDKKIDMLVVIPHRYNLLKGFFHKSSTKKMAFHSHVAMLALPENF